MQCLVHECISYVISNIHDVVRLPIDMSCLNDSLTKQISEKVPVERLNTLVDKRDKLTSKIFQKKCEKLLYLLVSDDSETANPGSLYNRKMHEFIWQDDVHHELTQLQQESVNVYLYHSDLRK